MKNNKLLLCMQSLSRRGVNLALRRNHLCTAAGVVFIGFHQNVTVYRFKNRLNILYTQVYILYYIRIFKKKNRTSGKSHNIVIYYYLSSRALPSLAPSPFESWTAPQLAATCLRAINMYDEEKRNPTRRRRRRREKSIATPIRRLHVRENESIIRP